MKKLLLILSFTILSFATLLPISQKIKGDNIIITYKVDKNTFDSLKTGYKELVKNTKKLSCSNLAAKELVKKYNIIYNYKFNNETLKVEIKKGSCNSHWKFKMLILELA